MLPVNQKLVDEFITASRVLVAVAVRSMDAADPLVTAPQHRILVLLAARGEQAIGDLASELNVNSSNATRHCDRLERKGLVARKRSESDRRAVRVSLTDRGHEVLDMVTRTRRAEIEAILQRMPSTACAGMLSALESFRDAAGEPPDHEWTAPTRHAETDLDEPEALAHGAH